tara:strand:- start:9 stop:1538 length:1530 start_codon:yes stop_codon:yes gene_type:complete
MAEEKKDKSFGGGNSFGAGTAVAGSWTSRVDWGKVASDLKNVEDLIAGKTQRQLRRKEEAQELGFADRKEMRQAKRAGRKALRKDKKNQKDQLEEMQDKGYADKDGNITDAGKAEKERREQEDFENLMEEEIDQAEENQDEEDGSPITFKSYFPLHGKKSPMKFGGGDAGFIANYRKSSPKQVNYGDIRSQVDAVADAYKSQVEALAKKELEAYDINEASVEGFKGFGNGQNMATEYFTAQKEELARLKNEAARTNYRGKRYKNLKLKMQEIEDDSINMNNRMKELQDAKLEWVNTNGYGPDGNGISTYSNGSNKENKHYLNEIFSKNAPVMMVDGKMVFTIKDPSTGESKTMSLDDAMEGVYKIDQRSKDALKNQRQELRKSVSDNLSFDEGTIKSDLDYMLRDAGDNQLMSWMYDDLNGTGRSFIEDFAAANTGLKEADLNPSSDLWKQKGFVDVLKEEIKEYYLEMSRGTYNKYQEASNNKGNYSEPEAENTFNEGFEQFLEPNPE